MVTPLIVTGTWWTASQPEAIALGSPVRPLPASSSTESITTISVTSAIAGTVNATTASCRAEPSAAVRWARRDRRRLRSCDARLSVVGSDLREGIVMSLTRSRPTPS